MSQNAASCPGVLAHANHSLALTSHTALKFSTDINEIVGEPRAGQVVPPDAELQLVASRGAWKANPDRAGR